MIHSRSLVACVICSTMIRCASFRSTPWCITCAMTTSSTTAIHVVNSSGWTVLQQCLCNWESLIVCLQINWVRRRAIRSAFGSSVTFRPNSTSGTITSQRRSTTSCRSTSASSMRPSSVTRTTTASSSQSRSTASTASFRRPSRPIHPIRACVCLALTGAYATTFGYSILLTIIDM